jgi:uncharacterized protein YegJ (DUF2314 family)
MMWVWIGIVAALVGLLGWWTLRRRRHRLVSFVALLREPMTLESAVLARLAGKAWQADLGDGSADGADGLVAGVEELNTIVHDGRMFLVNCFPRPYVANVEETSEAIGDLRIRSLFCEHQAWLSCDAMGVTRATPEHEVRDWYRRLAKLFLELLDDNCLLIFLPDSSLAYPINDQTEAALGAEDPVAALQQTQTVPVVQVSGDDPLMQQAVETARRDWPRFVAAYEEQAGANFSVKAPVTRDGNTEFIWISVTSIEGERINGTLANEPANLGSLKIGSKVSVAVADLNDWVYVDAQGAMHGGFTIQAVQQAARRIRDAR